MEGIERILNEQQGTRLMTRHRQQRLLAMLADSSVLGNAGSHPAGVSAERNP